MAGIRKRLQRLVGVKTQAQKLIEENLKTQAPTLDLGRCGLNGTEPALEQLKECTHLKTLILANVWWDWENRGEKSSENNGAPNQLIQLPAELPPNLVALIAGNNGLQQSTQDLRPLQNLTQLKTLNLQSNQIKELQPLQRLQQLNALDLSGNQIQELQPLQRLQQLTELYLNNNQIQELQPLQRLQQLTELYLNNNQIQELQPLQRLTQLNTLILYNNQIQELQPLQHLQQLKTLSLSDNQIQELSPLQRLQQLNRLYLENNQIHAIELAWLNAFPALELFGIRDNPIQNIPSEIVNSRLNNLDIIRNYLQSIEKTEDQTTLNEAKLIFVGVGEVGKTELAEAVSSETYRFKPGRETTKGIRIKQWQPKNCRLKGETIHFTANIWDFAGQEINYGTHQFFLTKNSVYVFVWTNRKGEESSDFNYWLRIVSLLSNNSPVFVVQNKVDDYRHEINQQKWQERFGNIRGFLKTSCKTGEGIDALREQVKSALLGLPHIQEIWNKHRYAVRQFLEEHQDDYITHQTYLQICEEEQVNAEDAGYLSQQLHDIGVILHFGDDTYLKNTVVLKPQWATAAAYLLRDSQIVDAGKFHTKDLNQVWETKRFATQHPFLLRLMERFELIFRLQESEEYIIPDLLPHQMPTKVNAVKAEADTPRRLHFEYHYEFMPKGILSRFICRMHEHIYQNLYWRYGVVLEQDDSFAKVTWDDTAVINTIQIEVWGEEAHYLLRMIRNHFKQIHKKLNNLPVQQKVPCVCPADCPHKDLPYLHDYDILKGFHKQGRKDFPCHKSYKDVSIPAMLEGIIDQNLKGSQYFEDLINAGKIKQFFEELSPIGVTENSFNQLRKEYIHNGGDADFADRLKVWLQTHFGHQRF